MKRLEISALLLKAKV